MLTSQLEIPSAATAGVPVHRSVHRAACRRSTRRSRRSASCISSTASTTRGRARAGSARPAVAAIRLRSRLRLRQAVPLPDRPRDDSPPRWSSCRCAAGSTCESSKKLVRADRGRKLRARSTPTRRGPRSSAGWPPSAPACRSSTTSTAPPATIRRGMLLNAFNALVEWHSLRERRPADRRLAELASATWSPAASRPTASSASPTACRAAVATIDRTPPTGTWTLGTVALFRPRKGIEVLLEALAALRSWGVDVRLRAVGGFETLAYETAILGLADRSGVAGADRLGRLHAQRRTPSWRRSTCSCCRACSAKACRWSCSKRWPPACRSSPRASKACPKRSCHRETGLLGRPR